MEDPALHFPEQGEHVVPDPALEEDASPAAAHPDPPIEPASPAAAAPAATREMPLRMATTPNAWATAHGALSAACVAMALIYLLAPGLVAKTMFGKSADPLDNQHHQLLQLNGGALLVAAAMAAGLALGGRNGDSLGTRSAGLSRRITDLLKLALAGHGLASTLCFGYYGGTITPLLMSIELATNGAMLSLPAADLLLGGRLTGLGSEVWSRLRAMPLHSPLSLAHHTLALLFPISGLLLLCFPRWTLFHLFCYSYGASAFQLAQLAGLADVLLIPAAQLMLKDAAERGALGSRAAVALNAGVLLAGAVHMRVLLPVLMRGHGGWMLPVLTSTWNAALLTSAVSLLVGRVGRAAGTTSRPMEAVVGEKQD